MACCTCDLDHLLLRQRKAAHPRTRIDSVTGEDIRERRFSLSNGQHLPPHALDYVGQLDREVLENSQVRAQRQLLMDKPHPEPHRVAGRVLRPDALAEQLDLARVGGNQAADDLHERR
jgi:hypothetical protein